MGLPAVDPEEVHDIGLFIGCLYQSAGATVLLALGVHIDSRSLHDLNTGGDAEQLQIGPALVAVLVFLVYHHQVV